jgi:hypothetical protein
MPPEQVVDGHKVQAAIDACYLWRGHVMKLEQFKSFKKQHTLDVVDNSLVFSGAFLADGQPFAIVKIDESPYGVEFLN